MAIVLQAHWLCSLYSKANGITNTPPNFRCRVELKNSLLKTIKPLDEIKGDVIITTDEPISFRGVRVQLNATISLKMNTTAQKPEYIKEGLIQGPSFPKANNSDYIYSAIRTELFGDKAVSETKPIASWAKSSRKRSDVTIEPGTHSYPFSLIMPVEPLPAPFKNQYGRLEYKIAAYMERKSETPTRLKDNPRFVQIAASFLKFTGFNNLSHYPPILMEPKIIKKYFQNTAITAAISLRKTAFLPEETIHFEIINLSNPFCHSLSRISTCLLRIIDYNAGRGSRERTIKTLDTFQSNEDFGYEDDIHHVGQLFVPKGCIPSYNVKSIYSVTYFIQYEITVGNNNNYRIKGNTEIVIGTTNEPCEVDDTIIINRRMSSLAIEPEEPVVMRRRSDSNASRLSDSSVISTVTLPPAYSQLSSRSNSLVSLETLPPHYDDIF